MSYQVARNSRNVLVPLALEDRHGERMCASLSRLDTATAMVIQVSEGGAFSQEFIPLQICLDGNRGYSGKEWELWAQKAGDKLCVYYLGVPDRLFTGAAEGKQSRSLSVQVVGTSPLSGREDFSGGVDITLQAQVAPPLIPGFLNLGERFFPALLPHNFIDHHVLQAFDFGGKRQAVLMVGIQVDPSDRMPVSLGKHWEAKNWMQAVVENLAPAPEAGGGYYSIKGGCFFGRNRKITHWFGRDIGLDEAGFREAATEKIRSLGRSGNGAWVFWLEPQAGAAGIDQIPPAVDGAAPRRIAIRHPMMHRMLRHPAAGTAAGGDVSIAELPAFQVAAALAQVARTLIGHQDVLQSALAEPSHADWSERAQPSSAELLAAEPRARRAAAGETLQTVLESDIRELYRSHGETLRSLESMFDETFGYSAWDSVGNPLRETLSEYLELNEANGANARTTA
ncbi:MAG: hypothetical protein ABI036_09595 [Fibrobacteria bacterium]